jgi:hypothetical protein
VEKWKRGECREEEEKEGEGGEGVEEEWTLGKDREGYFY